jgi:large subunit ribosomal protein L5
MSFALKNNQKRTQFLRSFYYKNLHKISFTSENMTMFLTTPKEISLKSLIKLSALLQLITSQRSFFLRAKKSSIASKIRKGAPLGVVVTLRKKTFSNFFSFLLWEIFPHIKNNSTSNNRKIKISTPLPCFSFAITNCLIFPSIKKFYILFKQILNIQCVISTGKKLTKAEMIFKNRYSSIPF